MSKPNLRQQAYRHIQRKILAGELTAGHLLSENQLAREIGISRTPVREAVRQFEHEGVLEQVPRFGTMVRRLQRRDLIELYQLREAIEPFAVAQAAGNVAIDDLRRLHSLCDELATIAGELENGAVAIADAEAMRRVLSADLAFHMLLIRAGGNTRMMKIVADSRMLTRIFGTPRQVHDLAIIEETHRYHRDILLAVERKEGEIARRLMVEHIQVSQRQAVAHYDRQQQDGDPANLPLQLPNEVLEELARIERKER